MLAMSLTLHGYAVCILLVDCDGTVRTVKLDMDKHMLSELCNNL